MCNTPLTSGRGLRQQVSEVGKVGKEADVEAKPRFPPLPPLSLALVGSLRNRGSSAGTPNTHSRPPALGGSAGRDKDPSHPLLVLLLSAASPHPKKRHSQTPRQKEGEGLGVEREEGPPHTEAFVGFPRVEVETLHISSVFVPPWGMGGEGGKGEGGVVEAEQWARA